jgi:hypothetical protein
VILLVMLVIVSMITLGVYTYSETMLTEHEAASMYERRAASRAFVDSGIEYVAALLGQQTALGESNYYHNPALFQGVVLRNSTNNAAGVGRFTIVAPNEQASSGLAVRCGLMNESSKINLNQIFELEFPPDYLDEYALEKEDAQRELLMGLPGMTQEVADAILDYIDDDDEVREFGFESEYYESLPTPYSAKNGPLESIEELLKVAGVTPEMLLGEDMNRNGLLDPNENDGDASLPYDNEDGILALGWGAYLTVHSKELNRRSDGSPRIYLNNNILTELYDELLEEFGDEDIARFVVAFRMNGPVGATEDDIANQNNISSGNRQQINQAAQGLAQSLFRAAASGDAAELVTRGGIDLSAGAQVSVQSIYDLIDVQVEVEVDGTSQTLDSPWSADPADMQSYLPQLLDALSTTSEEYLVGRININECRPEVLQGIPGMTTDLLDGILASQMIDPSGIPREETIQRHATSGWLVMEGLIDLEQMRAIAPWLTARGDVYRAQVVGFFDGGGPFTRVEAVIDATQNPVGVVMVRDLSELGRGYLNSELTGIIEQSGTR